MTQTNNDLDHYLDKIVEGLNALAGDEVGPSGQSWQDVAEDLSRYMRMYAGRLDQLRFGNAGGTVVFPSLQERVNSE